MALKRFKPTTAGRRGMTSPSFDEITTNKPEKSLLTTKKKTGGRNNAGKISVRHIGGGNRQKYRVIDFKETKIIFLQKLQALNMIQTDLHILHF